MGFQRVLKNNTGSQRSASGIGKPGVRGGLARAPEQKYAVSRNKIGDGGGLVVQAEVVILVGLRWTTVDGGRTPRIPSS